MSSVTQTTTDSATKDNESTVEPPSETSEAAVDFLEMIGKNDALQFGIL